MSDSKVIGNDERLKKSDGAAVRGDRAQEDNGRTQADGTVLTMEERRKLLRSDWNQEILPTPPQSSEWHYCWLSTTNSSDPIYKRMQKGYEPVKASEIPGFKDYRITEGEYEGCVACNEMLLFKLPMELYQDIMSYFHHELPQEEEEMLRANLPVQDQDSNGRNLGQVEGFDTLNKRVRTPLFE